MLHRYALLVALAALAGPPSARADAPKPAEPGPWKLGAVTSLNLAQSSFSTRWKGGDRGSIVWVLNGEVSGERQFSRHYNLQNVLRAAYGQTARQAADPNDASRLAWSAPDKTTDLLSFESNSRWTLETWVDPYLSLGAETQFQDQSSPLGTIRFNPIKLKETAGAARVLEKTESAEIITRLGFGFRQTLAQSFDDPVARTKASFTTNDGGFEWQTTVTQPLLQKKVLYQGKLLVFQPVFYSKSGDLETVDRQVTAYVQGLGGGRESVKDFWRATDADFQNQFTAQITRLLGVTLYAELMYDKFDSAANVDPKLPAATSLLELDRNTRKAGQFKQTLALALTYRLF
jgi:hypothetical protein